MEDNSFYLYCFTRADAEVPVINGVGNSDPPFAIIHGDIAMITSDHAKKRYPLSRKNLMAHQGVIEAVMAKAPVMPMRFGTVAAELDDIQAVLESQHDEIAQALERLTGVAEYAVRVRWTDEAKTLADIGANDPQVIQYKEQLEQRGQASYQDRINLGQLVEQALALRCAAISEALQALAAEHAVAHSEAESKDITNLALLMSPDQYADYMTALEAYDASLVGELRIKVTGPLPPFSFSDMNLNWAEGKAGD